mgnify:CR=1 FL=1
MVLQQFGGVNAIAFYANSIFISAGKDHALGLSLFYFIFYLLLFLWGYMILD